MSPSISSLFSLDGKVAIVTGGTGVLGGAMAHGLAAAGAKVAILGRREDRAAQMADDIQQAGGEAIPLPADVLQPEQLETARHTILQHWGRIDILVNSAGGNVPGASLSNGDHFFDLSRDAVQKVFDLNLMGTILPCQVFGAAMAGRGEGTDPGKPEGCIINISSMTADRAVSRLLGYSAAKAAIDNFTRWLAVEVTRKYGPGMRVNAIAPGFFIGEQNRALLTNPDGTPSARGARIIELTPAGRFGEAEELIGTLIWLCSPAAAFVNGVIVPVDGGFSAFSGV